MGRGTRLPVHACQQCFWFLVAAGAPLSLWPSTSTGPCSCHGRAPGGICGSSNPEPWFSFSPGWGGCSTTVPSCVADWTCRLSPGEEKAVMLSNILSCQSSCPHFSAAFLKSRGGLLSSGFLWGSVQPLWLVLNLQGPFSPCCPHLSSGGWRGSGIQGSRAGETG